MEDAESVLGAGAGKISINSPALADPTLIDSLARRFGSQCVVVGIDSQTRRETDTLRYEVWHNTGDPDRAGATARETGSLLPAALFLVAGASASTDSGVAFLGGGAAGFAVAAALGYGVYRGSHLLPIRQFFTVSGIVVLVLASAGVIVMNHGNRGITSKCGSADLLSALGVNLEAPPELLRRALAELGARIDDGARVDSTHGAPSELRGTNAARMVASSTVITFEASLSLPIAS